MRKIATVTDNPEVKRVMLCESDEGCYIFLYNSDEDGSGYADYLQDSTAEAEELCYEDYGIKKEEWKSIPDTQAGCQDDWIAPVRVIGRAEGTPQWGDFERLLDGQWKPINTEQGGVSNG